MEKKFKVSPGDEIIITVPKKQPSANEILMRRPPSPPKGMIRARRINESFPRRLKKKDGFFNIYDFGYRLNTGTGLFEDVNLTVVPPEIYTVENLLTESDYANLYDFFLSVPREDWKDRFKRWSFTDARKYQTQLYFVTYPSTLDIVQFDSEENWTEDGLKLTDIQKAADIVILADNLTASQPISSGFYPLFLRGDESSPPNHITNVFDRNAPAVELPLDGKLDLYHVPAFMRSTGISTKLSSPQKFLMMNDIFTTFTRRMIFDADYQFFGGGFVQNQYFNQFGVPPDSHEDFKRAVSFAKSLDGSRAVEVTSGTPVTIPLTSFPGSFVDEAVIAQGTMTFTRQDNIDNVAGTTLKAIIVRNDSQVYYVW